MNFMVYACGAGCLRDARQRRREGPARAPQGEARLGRRARTHAGIALTGLCAAWLCLPQASLADAGDRLLLQQRGHLLGGLGIMNAAVGSEASFSSLSIPLYATNLHLLAYASICNRSDLPVGCYPCVGRPICGMSLKQPFNETCEGRHMHWD